MAIFFNRNAWREFNSALSHQHTFESDHGYMPISAPSGQATLLRCKCGQAQWVFSSCPDDPFWATQEQEQLLSA